MVLAFGKDDGLLLGGATGSGGKFGYGAVVIRTVIKSEEVLDAGKDAAVVLYLHISGQRSIEYASVWQINRNSLASVVDYNIARAKGLEINADVYTDQTASVDLVTDKETFPTSCIGDGDVDFLV